MTYKLRTYKKAQKYIILNYYQVRGIHFTRMEWISSEIKNQNEICGNMQMYKYMVKEMIEKKNYDKN